MYHISKMDNGTCKDCDKACPFWMNDGRSFGTWSYGSRCQSQYRSIYGQTIPEKFSSYEYKQFLTQNAEKIIRQEQNKALERVFGNY